MNVTISKSQIHGGVCVPPSKSVAHRVMIATALSGGSLHVDNGGADMLATERCLDAIAPQIHAFLKCCDGRRDCALGCDKPRRNESVRDEVCRDIVLNAGESGSTLRFLLPVVCALGIECDFIGEGRLKDRPLGGLIGVLGEHGAIISSGKLPLHISGRLSAGEYRIDGSVSSQYVTGLLFALPLLDGDSEIVVEGELVSKSYVEITLGVLKGFGVTATKTDRGYLVKGNQKFIRPEDVSVEGDWSSAGFMLALGVLGGEVRVGGLKANSLQGDKIVVDLLRRAGADISVDGEDFVARKSELFAIDFDAQDCPDAVPIMATVLSFASGVSHIKHVDRLRDKESDRLGAVREMLSAFGIKTEYSDDELAVYGGEHIPARVESYGDHRMAMSAAVCALCTDGESEVEGMECIAKSYPTFLEHARGFGANIREI